MQLDLNWECTTSEGDGSMPCRSDYEKGIATCRAAQLAATSSGVELECRDTHGAAVRSQRMSVACVYTHTVNASTSHAK